MKKTVGVIAIVLVSVLVFFSCKKNEIYPDIPSLEFKSYSLVLDPSSNDTLIDVVVSYRDGDGDIGLDQGDTLPPYNRVQDSTLRNTNPYYNNLFVDYYEQVNGQWQRVINPASKDTVKFEFRIGNITPEGKHRAIRGDIDVSFSRPLFAESSDTVMLKVYIYDRALHKSNTAISPVIILPSS